MQDTPNLNLSTIAALQQKRTLAFVNHFVVNTAQFLNNFSKKCEDKLMNFERKLEKVEAAMVLLETRLSSIPEVENIQETKSNSKAQSQDSPPEKSDRPSEIGELIPAPDIKEQKDEETTEVPETESSPPVEYERFVKMIQVGVPLQAVKLKVSMEGLDPNILEQIIVNKKL